MHNPQQIFSSDHRHSVVRVALGVTGAILLAAGVSSLFPVARADEPLKPIAIEVPQRTTPVDAAEVLAVLKKNCVACHHAKEAESGVALDSVEALRKGGDSGPLLVAGKAAESQLLRVAAHQT